MSDKANHRRAKPLFVADVKKPNGDVKSVINDNDKKFANAAQKALTPYTSHKYNKYFDFTGKPDPTDKSKTIYEPSLLDLLHFHVNGEYRLTIEQGVPNLRFATTRYHDATRNESPLRRLELSRGFDNFTTTQMTGLHGLRDPNGNLNVGTSQFFNRLIQSNDPGAVFFLPSLGTAVMSLMAYTQAWPTSLRKYFIGNTNNQSGGRIPELFDKLRYNADSDDDKKLAIGDRDLGRAPWFEVGYTSGFENVLMYAYNLSIGDSPDIIGSNRGGGLPERANLFFLSWASAIVSSPEIMELTDNDDYMEIVSRICQCAIRATFTTHKRGMNFDEANNMSFDTPADMELPNNYNDPSDMNIYGATEEFFRFIRETAEQQNVVVDPWVGKTVTLDDSSEWYNDLFVDLRQPFGTKELIETTAQAKSLEWLLHGSVTDVDDEGDEIVSWEADGEWYVASKQGGGYILKQTGHELLFADDGDPLTDLPDGLGDERTYQLPYWVPPSIFNETDDEDEELTESTKGFNAALTVVTRIALDRYFEMESHLLLTLNSTKIAFNRFSKEKNDGNAQYNADLTPRNEFYTTSGKGKTPVADFLAEQRAIIMSGVYASYVALTKDSGFKKMFEQDMVELEVKWYTNTIAERLLAATRIEQQQSALSELRADPVPGTAQAVQLVSPQTILRRLDIPTLRLIMAEYFQSFYRRVGELAKEFDARPQSKNKKKKGKKQKLVVKMWDTVEATLVTVLSLEGTRPHLIWTEVFRQVEKARTRSGNVSTPTLPPSWAGTVYKEQLTRDPALIGKTPDIEKNALTFRNYVGFLRSAFAEDYNLIAGLLTAIQTVTTKQITDIDELRRFFEERLKSDEKYKVKNQTVGAYRQFIYICRGVLSMPVYQLALGLADDRAEEQARRGGELVDAVAVQGDVVSPMPTPPPTTLYSYEGTRANPSLLRPDGGV